MLVLDRLSKRYGGRRALTDVSFTVEPGTVHGFVGPNGAGKTTAMRIVLGVLEPDRGSVSWQGQDVTHEVRRRFGYMPEERGLYPRMRVGEQLVHLARLHGMPAREAQRSMERWLTRMGLGDRERERVEQLSLGNQQRVQLAAALVHDPELLVLDEPFSGLDPVGVEVLSGVLREQAAAGVPVLFSSHQLELVEQLCSTVTIVADGEVVADGPVESLRRGSRQERRLVVEAAPSWQPRWPGARDAVPVAGGLVRHVLTVPVGQEQEVLADALTCGTVARFAPTDPTLAELFREAVGA